MAELAFDSTVNYQKIYLEDSVPLTIANPAQITTAPILHNLGYQPNVRVWYTNASGKICPAAGAIVDSLISGTTSDFALYQVHYTVSTTSLKLIFDRGITVGPTVNTTVYYRIYLDAA